MVRSLLSLLATLSLVALCSGCGSRAKAEAKATPAPAHVDTVSAAQGEIHPVLSLAGVVTPYRQVGIAANLAEPILEVNVQEGDAVHSGQVLARLVTDDLEAQLAASQRVVAEDVARYTQTSYQINAVNAQDTSAIGSARSVLRQDQLSLAGAQTDLTRYEELAAQGYLPQQTLDQQRTTVATDAAAVRSAQDALDQAIANARANGNGRNAGGQQAGLAAARAAADAAQANVVQLQRQISRAVVVAPVDGIVDAVNANPGEFPSGRELFTIEQLSSVYVLLASSTAQVAQLRTGAAASITAAGTGRNDRGTVAAVLDQLQPGTTNFTVKVLVPNGDGHLRAGMPVSGTVDLPVVRGIKIPVSAFVDDLHAAVYAVVDGVVQTANVREIKNDGTDAIVTGLAAGAMIIKDAPASNVGNGDRVQTGPLPAPSVSPGARPAASPVASATAY